MLAFRYRLYPTKEQEQVLTQSFGNARFVYNWGMAKWQELYAQWDKCSYGKLAGLLVDMKKENVRLKLSGSQTLQASLKNLETWYKNFFSKRASHPQFKSKSSKQSITYPQFVKIVDWNLSLPKIWQIKTVMHRELQGNIKMATITKTASWKYYVSITTDYELGKPTTSGQVWIDVGIKEFAHANIVAWYMQRNMIKILSSLPKTNESI